MKVQFGWARCPQGHDYDPTYGACPQCHPRRSPFWFRSQLRAATVAFIVTLSIIGLIVTAHARSPLSIQVFTAGQPAAGETVTATNERTLVAAVTDGNGYADLGNLAPGDWQITACGQNTTYTSIDAADVAAILLINCHRIWLPIVTR